MIWQRLRDLFNGVYPEIPKYPATRRFLQELATYDQWGNPTGPAGGDLSGNYPDPSVVGIEGYPIQNTAPTDGDALLFNGTLSRWEHSPITFSGGPPTGPAGGDLGGLYPNPQVVGLYNNPINASALTPTAGNILAFDGTNWTPGLPGGDLTGTYPNPVVDGLQTTPVSATAPNVGEYLRYTGGAWTPTPVTPGSPDAIYGTFASSITQTVSKISSGSATVAVFDPALTDSNGVSLVSTTRLTVASSGVYAVNVSAQLVHSGGTTRTVYFWIRKNGANLPASASSLEMGNNNNRTLPFVELVLKLNASDYIEWSFTYDGGNADTLQLACYPEVLVAPAIPAIPGVIANVKRLGNIV